MTLTMASDLDESLVGGAVGGGMTGEGGEQRVRLTVETSSIVSDDAFPDFSDPNLFSASSPATSAATLSPADCSSASTSEVEGSRSSLIFSPGGLGLGGGLGGGGGASSANSSGTGSRFLLPLPTPSSNASQTSFALSEVSVSGEDGSMDVLAPEILSADISISADGRFVETTSGPAARELKRRYDQYLGVNKDMRSPYVITAIINQHGKQVYRVGLRTEARAQEPSPTPELEMPLNTARTSPPASQAHRKRVSRMSITSVFKHVQSYQQQHQQQQQQRAPEELRTSTASMSPVPSTQQPRKLRKPRSIPDLASATGSYFGDAVSPQPPPATGRAHSHSVTGADMPRPTVQTTTDGVGVVNGSGSSSISNNVVEAPARPTGDAFSNVMGWLAPPVSPMTSSGMTPSSHSLLTPSDTPSQSPLEMEWMDPSHPFGQNVSFDSPFRSSAVYLPSVIREMQSFESAKTARADPRSRGLESEMTEVLEEVETPQQEQQQEQQRPDSLDSLASLKAERTENGTKAMPETNGSLISETKSEPRAIPSEASSLYTRFSTTVFDVIQNYRGLPMLDALSERSRQPTIKMSLSTLDGAVPRDDPRFVIWGDVSLVSDSASVVERASIQGSASARSRPQSHVFSVHSRKRSLKGKSHGHSLSEVPDPSPERGSDCGGGSSSVDDAESTHRVLMAATIERWIAQLTSQFDYDELLIFFLTYRTYIDALDLCHLLICRFHWALEEPMSPQEVMVKQIVRVRTFVAIRYWLLTFFRIDFLPNRELCLLFADWLNTLWRDSILDKYNDARNIVKKLKKVAKDCKEAHSRVSKSNKKAEKKGKVMQSIDKIFGDLSSGVNFAATLRKVSAAQHEEEDSDVDLDFNPDESSPFSDTIGIQGFASFANQLGPGDANDARRTSISGPGASSAVATPSRSIGTTSRILLQQPLHLTILQHARALPPGASLPLVGAPSTLPVHHSSLSRAVVRTIGRLGRWKRVLSSRVPTSPVSPAGDTTAAFDLELNEAGDLFTVCGGVEQYLKMIDPAPVSPVSPASPEPPNKPEPPQVTISVPNGTDEEKEEGEGREDIPPRPASPTPSPSPQDTEPASRTPIASNAELRSESPVSNENTGASQGPARGLVHKTLSRIRSSEPAESVRSGSSGSIRSFETTSFLGNPIPKQQRLFPDVVSIDDLDYLSDNSSDESGPAMPPGLRPGKRLPNRRDFEFVHRSVDSVSSMGIISRASVAMSEQADSARSSASQPRGLGNALQQWQMDALIEDLGHDDEEEGGAEAALRRLEGQINPTKQRQKEAKVDGWVRHIQERMAAGDFGHEEPPDEDGDEDEDVVGSDEENYGAETGRMRRDSTAIAEEMEEDMTISVPRSSSESAERPTGLTIETNGHGPVEPFTPTPRQTTHPVAIHSIHATSDAKPRINEAVPEEILLSRLPSRTSANDENNTKTSPPQRTGHPTFILSKTSSAPAHRSFILHFSAEMLAQHFAVIDREIFLGIKFEELVSDEWYTSAEDFNVRDWMQFLRDRRRKAELRGKGKISVLSAARARFNLVANFVVSEIALTNPHDRVYVVSKFIRIAWKAYTINNFATLVAIISGLSNDWVRKAMKRSWNRVGKWETRVFEDLKAFCTAEDDFRYIRRAIAALVDAKPLTAQEDSTVASSSASDVLPTNGMAMAGGGKNGKAAADGKAPAPTSCVPFIGVYLSQLRRYSRLPDLIDPSAPTEAVLTDPETGNFKSPAHPEVFADLRPLPPSMQIEPLINVQKQRQIAGVIKSLVAGQHLANKVDVSDVDKRLLSRCLKLSAIDVDQLQRILGVYSDY
ncbi:hypothetical protein ACEPAG_9508 [Sanghuangporus baumii]